MTRDISPTQSVFVYAEAANKGNSSVCIQTPSCGPEGLIPISCCAWVNTHPSTSASFPLIYTDCMERQQNYALVFSEREKNKKRTRLGSRGEEIKFSFDTSRITTSFWDMRPSLSLPLVVPFPSMPLTLEVTCHWKMPLRMQREDPLVSFISSFCC